MQRSFSPRAVALAGVAGLVLLAGCGSSKHATASTAATTPTTPQTATSTTSPASTQTTPGTPTSTKKSGTTPIAKTKSTSNPTGGAGLPSGSGSGGSGGSGGSSGGGSSGGGSTNARVPATFTIASGGQLSPPTVSAPAFLAVQLTVVSRDGQAHQVLLRTPTPHKLAVPAHGHATVLIPGLRAGSYPLEIDGAARGALTIGGEPGP
jgi:hypothetical protein